MSKRIPNKQYDLTEPNSLAARVIGHQRRRMYDRFIAENAEILEN
jgi:hypothetical protein